LRILVYRIGQLGDTVVALPALWAVRRQFPDARLVLLGNAHARFVQAQDVLPPSGLIDEYVTYPVGASRIAAFWGLLARLRASRFDALVYLAPRRRTRAQVWRDLAFFRLAGIRRVFGHHGFTPLPARPAGAPLPALEQEADHLLGRLASSGIPVPSRGRGEMDLALTGEERAAAESWLRAHVPADARGAGLVGIGPGSKQASKVWPEDRFVALGRRLVAEHRLFPVIFGGPEDRALGERLVRAWGRGSNAAGSLAIRVTAATRERHRHHAPCRRRQCSVRCDFFGSGLAGALVPLRAGTHRAAGGGELRGVSARGLYQGEAALPDGDPCGRRR
jgi:heptosyltransferase-3